MSKLEEDLDFMNKYSRQLGAYGVEAMAKLIKLKVLVCGLKGLGMEIVKNLTLAGPGAITLSDDELVEMKDLGSNFFLTEDHIGKTRASCVIDSVKELNDMVKVSIHEGDLTEKLVSQHDCVVFVNQSRKSCIRWDAFCRGLTTNGIDGVATPTPIVFISTEIFGASGTVFSDFGDNFLIRDDNGEPLISRTIKNMYQDGDDTVVELINPMDSDLARRHNLSESIHDGYVTFSEVKGMELSDGTSINGDTPWKIRHEYFKKDDGSKGGFNAYAFRIADTSGYSKYISGGTITQHKKPFLLHHKSLSSKLFDYGFLPFTDGTKFGRAEQLHVCYQAIHDFVDKHDGALPRLNHIQDAEEVVELATKRNEAVQLINRSAATSGGTVDEVDVDVVKSIAMLSRTHLQPLCAFFGGIVAQEVVKLTGKFTPISQWLPIDFLEILPTESPEYNEIELKVSRYFDLIAVYGEEFVKTLHSVRTYMVGCGALGCEFLKNFAMLGIACGPQGLITVTDNDRVEISNLNRQFLFRKHNVGKAKSVGATEAIKKMNNTINVDCKELLAMPSTENVFNDAFFKSLDFVTNALDNVKAREYIDERCVFYGIPLLESGTQGTKCNSQVIIPSATESYTDQQDGDMGDAIPMCTLRNFPSQIEHCIEWSRSMFEDDFCKPFGDLQKFMEDKADYISELEQSLSSASATVNACETGQNLLDMIETFERIHTLNGDKDAQFNLLIEVAYKKLHYLFRDKILNLIHDFPEDFTTKEGKRFWSPPKRFPNVMSFDKSDKDQMNFIVSYANILAVCFGLVPEFEFLSSSHDWRSVEYVSKVCATFTPDTWSYQSSGEKEDGTEEEKKSSVEDDSNRLKSILSKLGCTNTDSIEVQPADFEKDEDANFHIDFITSTSNLRASNYQLKQVTRHKCKMIAGKIIAAIATTTASVTGLIMIEMLKLINKKPFGDIKLRWSKPTSAYRNSSNNLANNSYFFSEPNVAKQAQHDKPAYDGDEDYIRARPLGFTKWDKTVIDQGSLTINAFIEAFKTQCDGLEICTMASPVAHLCQWSDRVKGSLEAQCGCSAVTKNVKDIPTRKQCSYYKCKGIIMYGTVMFGTLKEFMDTYGDKPLEEAAQVRYSDLAVQHDRRYLELEISAEMDDIEYRIPSVVYYF